MRCSHRPAGISIWGADFTLVNAREDSSSRVRVVVEWLPKAFEIAWFVGIEDGIKTSLRVIYVCRGSKNDGECAIDRLSELSYRFPVVTLRIE